MCKASIVLGETPPLYLENIVATAIFTCIVVRRTPEHVLGPVLKGRFANSCFARLLPFLNLSGLSSFRFYQNSGSMWSPTIGIIIEVPTSTFRVNPSASVPLGSLEQSFAIVPAGGKNLVVLFITPFKKFTS